MGKKLLVSLAMEGKFCREGLQSLEEDDDMLTAMARELVTERGIGESANEVWRQIQAEQTRPLPVPTASIEEATTVGNRHWSRLSAFRSMSMLPSLERDHFRSAPFGGKSHR